MIRGTFANIRLRNQLAPGTEGGVTVKDGKETSIYDASRDVHRRGHSAGRPRRQGVRLGSSRDWAAKGTALLGVRAVLVESFERIHRSNLIGMGVLPLQFKPGENAESLGLTGEETFSIEGITALNEGTAPSEVTVTADDKGSPRRSASTPPARRSTTATAASCSTSCAHSASCVSPGG